MHPRTPFYLLVFIAIQLVHFQFQKGSCAAKSKRNDCPSSSCGKISEIKSPFRLKSDPEDCGDPRYELACENNTINNSNGTCFLYLFSGKYRVEAIYYDNYTIRLVDSASQDQQYQRNDFHCVSIPDYTLYQYNFSYGKKEPYNTFRYEGVALPNISKITIPIMVVFWHCSQPVVGNPRFVNVTPCSDSNEFIYATVGRVDFQVGCHAKRVTLASEKFMYEFEKKHPVANRSYSAIGNALAYGFELSWLDGVCKYYCPPKSCYFNPLDRIRGIQCDVKPSFKYFAKTYLDGVVLGFKWIVSGDDECSMNEILPNISHPQATPILNDYLAKCAGMNTGPIILVYYLQKYIFGILLVIAILLYKWRRRHLSMYRNIENFLSHNNLMPIRYSYKEIKTMTKCFKDKLGEGGYGCVYKGKLHSGPYVAIKILNKSKGNGEDFINEVATIGRIHHVNVVRLVGFCVEGSKHALVYEFMLNGSLDKHIFSQTTNISCDKMCLISLGIAKGMDYLHQGCQMQILHFDIKPHNILLDENFVPKISDFGLAKLYAVDESIATVTARGTLGYMAPELYYKNVGRVSYKADVYSFGMLLMEMASRRKNLNLRSCYSSGDNLSQLYFPTWIHDQLIEGKDFEIESMIDEEEKNITMKMIVVALWCIQMNPEERPSMKRVVEMLEGDHQQNIVMPPRPALYPRARQVVKDSDCISNHQKECGDNLENHYTSSETTSISMSMSNRISN